MEHRLDAVHNLVMLPRDAPTDVLNELQLVQDFYGADSPADHQRVMALFAPNAQLDLPQMHVSGRDNISAVMFYAKSFIADIDMEPYMVEIAMAGGGAATSNHGGPHLTTSTAPTSSTTSTDSTSSTCTSAATSKRRRLGGKPPKAPSTGAATAGMANGSGPNNRHQQPSRLGRSKHQSSLGVVSPPLHEVNGRQGRASAARAAAAASSDLTDHHDGGTAQNTRQPVPQSMSRTYVYAVATVTPKALPRMLTLNMLPREIHIRTRITLVWDDEAGEVLVLQERPDNLPVGLVPATLKRTVGRALGLVSTASQWILGRLLQLRIISGRLPGLHAYYGTGI